MRRVVIRGAVIRIVIIRAKVSIPFHPLNHLHMEANQIFSNR